MADPAIVEALLATDLFGALDKKAVGKLADRCSRVFHAAGKQVATEGDGGVGFHLIATGTASVTVNGQSRPALGPGSYFGEISLIDGKPRSATVVATEPMTTYSLVAWDFTPLLQSEPSVAHAMLLSLCRRLRAIEQS